MLTAHLRWTRAIFLCGIALLGQVSAAHAADDGESPKFLQEKPKQRIVFVCGGDASMVRKHQLLRDQLKKVVEKFKSPQQFNIIFMQGATPVMCNKDGLLPATPESRARVAAFVDNIKLVPTKQTAPSISAAFAQKPDLIYLLTDADIKDRDAVFKALKTLNKPDDHGMQPVKINTIAFFDEKNLDKDAASARKTLEQIAQQNGGDFRVVDTSKINE